MKLRASLAGLLPFLRTAALVDLGIFAAVGVICWLCGWRTVHAYGTGLFWAGVATMALGLASLRTTWGLTRSGGYQLGQTVAADGMARLTDRGMGEVRRSYDDLLHMVLIGLVPFVVGLLIGGA